MIHQIGGLVTFRNENYVILEIANNDDLKIKNILTQKVIIISADLVEPIKIKKHQYNNQNVNDKPSVPSQNVNDKPSILSQDTVYIKSLFDQVGKENTADFFNSTTDETTDLTEAIDQKETFDTSAPNFKTRRINNYNDGNITDQTNDLHLVENLIPPNGNVITPRRMIHKSQLINETLSDIPYILNDNSKTVQTQTNNINENNNDLDFFAKKSNDNLSKKENTNTKENIKLKKKHKDKYIEKLAKLETVKNEHKNNDDLIKQMPNINIKDFSLTTPTQKVVLGNFNHNVGKYKDKYSEKQQNSDFQVESIIEKHKNISNNENKKEFEEYNAIKNETNTIFGNEQADLKLILSKTKIYQKFKSLSRGLIAIFILTLFMPIIGIILKIVNFNVSEESANITLMGDMKINFNNNSGINDILNLIANLFLIVVTPIFIVTFLIYLVTYLVVLGDRNYKKIARFNYILQNNIDMIDSIQDFNNEVSLFMVKIHKDNKEMKKRFEKSDEAVKLEFNDFNTTSKRH